MRLEKFAFVAAIAALFAQTRSDAQTIDPYYASDYSLLSLGSPPGVPSQYGGLTLKRGTTDRLLIGGAANTASGMIYEIQVSRDANNHIDGFVGTAVPVIEAWYNDGGVVYLPGTGVLFCARWPVNELGQYREGSTTPDKIIDMTPLGVTSSLASLNFVPNDYPAAAGRIKLCTWASGDFYDATISPDGMGTYNISMPTYRRTLPGGPEGFVYVPQGSPLMPNTMLVSEYSAGLVGAYEVDANGDPEIITRRTFISGLFGAEGAFVDPLTGDFLFSTFGGGQQVVVVRGFATPAILQGTVALQDFSGDPTGTPVAVEVRNPGSLVPLETHNVTLDGSGSFSVQTSRAPGAYDVACKPSHWLRRTLSAVNFTSTGASVAFAVINGDCDGDNEITIGDYAVLSAAFGSVPGDPNWDPNADLDGDGEVTIGDYAILSSNFGQVGDD